jgi:cytochrome c553
MSSRRDFRRVVRTLATAATVVTVVSPLTAIAASSDNIRAFGQYLSGECVTCHLLTGRSASGVPKIVALPTDQFIAALKSYKQKQRPNAVMQAIAARLSDEEMAALAAYFASLSPR